MPLGRLVLVPVEGSVSDSDSGYRWVNQQDDTWSLRPGLAVGG
jgi:hypothetical protein